MNSEDSVSQILINLSEWTPSEVQENLDRVLPVLQSSLETTDQKALSLQAVQALLGTCLPCVAVDNLETDVLQHALPAAKALFIEAVNGIQEELLNTPNVHSDEVINTITSLLHCSIELLNCLELTMHHIISLGRVEVSVVPSIPKAVVCILFGAYKHIKDSQQLYGDFLQHLHGVITSLLHKSHKVQMTFFGMMNDNLHFNCEYEDDLVMLTEVLEMLGQAGEIVFGLDVKTMAELWKGYIHLAQVNAEHLRPWLDVANPIKFLAQQVVYRLKAATGMGQGNDTKAVTQTLKIGSFALKIINKLCEHYAGYLGDCNEELVTFLLTLHLHCQSYLQWKLVPSSLTEEVERHLIVGADPLLTLLLAQLDFVDSYFKCEVKPSDEDDHLVGFILLSNVILKKLLHSDHTVRQLWHNSDRSMLSKLFCRLDDCHAEMCWELNVTAVTSGSGSSESIQLYEAVLTHVAAFVVCCPVDEFHLVEQVLLESILQPTVWRAMLASDIWCILARYGSSELCFEHVCYLIGIIQSIPNHAFCPERTYLAELLGRLFPLLSDKSKSEVVTLFPPCENIALWGTLPLKHLPEKLKYSYADKIMAMANVRIEVFLHSSASVGIYNSMLESLMGILSVLDSDSEIQPGLLSSLTSHVITLWQCATLPEVFSSEETSEKGSQWLHCFMAALCRVTSCLVMYMNNSELLQVLPRLQTILPKTSSSIKISATSILKALATKFVDPTDDQPAVFHKISNLFSSLLQDKHALVHQMALETFTCFAYVTQHEEVVALAVDGNKTLECQVGSYIQKLTLDPMPGDINWMAYEDYLLCQTRLKFLHKCVSKNVCTRTTITIKETFDPKDIGSDLNDQVAKRPKLAMTDTSVLETIAQMGKHANFITTFSKENTLPQSAIQAIRDVHIQLGRLVSPQ